MSSLHRFGVGTRRHHGSRSRGDCGTPANAGDAYETEDPDVEAEALRLEDNKVEAVGTGTNIDVNVIPKGTGTLKTPSGYEANVSADEDVPNKEYCDDNYVSYAAQGQATTGTGATVGQVAVTGLTTSAVIICTGAEAGADVAYVVAAAGHFTVFDASDAELDAKKVNYVVLSL
jgi:hypothetical protein